MPFSTAGATRRHDSFPVGKFDYHVPSPIQFFRRNDRADLVKSPFPKGRIFLPRMSIPVHDKADDDDDGLVEVDRKMESDASRPGKVCKEICFPAVNL